MHRLLFIFLVASLFGQMSFAQSTAPFPQLVSLHWVPSSLGDPWPRWRFGVDYVGDNRWAYGLDIGWGNALLNRFQLDDMGLSPKYSLIEVRPEVKFLLGRRPRRTFYTATELFFIKNVDQLEKAHYYPRGSDFAVAFDFADMQRTKVGAHLKMGIKFIAFKHLDFDFYAGLGAARRQIDYRNIVNGTKYEWGDDFHEWHPNIQVYEGSKWVFHMAYGYKIGVLLWR